MDPPPPPGKRVSLFNPRCSSSWTLVSVALDRRLLWCRGVLPLWEEFGRLAAAAANRLQTLQSHAEASLSGAAADEDSVERLAGDLQRVQVRTGTGSGP